MMLKVIHYRYLTVWQMVVISCYFGFVFEGDTVNSKIFARILFSRIALKDILVTLEIRDLGMIYVYQ